MDFWKKSIPRISLGGNVLGASLRNNKDDSMAGAEEANLPAADLFISQESRDRDISLWKVG